MGMDTKNEDTDSGGSRDRARLERSSEATTSGEEQILSNGNGNGDADQGGRSTETHWRKIRTSFAEESETSPAGVGGGGGGGGTSSSGGATRKGGGMKQVISNVMHKAANSHLNILRRSQADLELYDCGPTMPTPEPVCQPAVPSASLDKNPSQDAITVPLQDDERDASMRNTFFSTPSRTRVDTYDLPPPSSDARFSLPTLAEAREELEKARVHFLTVLSSLHIECGFGGDLPRSDSN